MYIRLSASLLASSPGSPPLFLVHMRKAMEGVSAWAALITIFNEIATNHTQINYVNVGCFKQIEHVMPYGTLYSFTQYTMSSMESMLYR